MFIRLNNDWAVGMIDNPPQWTLCFRKTWKGKEQWQAVSFCQTRKALLRAVDEKVVRGGQFYRGSANAAVEPSALAQIERFPARVDATVN